MTNKELMEHSLLNSDIQGVVFWSLMDHKDMLKAWVWKDIPFKYKVMIKLKMAILWVGGTSEDDKIVINIMVYNNFGERLFMKNKDY